ncbi:cytochrome P450 [Xylariaceae sp. AK1471]|nr:cytochrome P450 [Xylariaceae sp. AK1471]
MFSNDTFELPTSQVVPSISITNVFIGTSLVLLLVHLLVTKQNILFKNSVVKTLAKRIYTWKYLLNGAAIIQAGFDRAEGNPFEVLAPDARYIFVSSIEHIKEVDNAPDTVLSLQAASKQMLQPVYTMYGFDWFDRRGTEGVGFVRTLRTLLTNNLPSIMPDLATLIRVNFLELYDGSKIINGQKHSPVYPFILKLVILCNSRSFFGKELCNNEPFMLAARNYVEETLICAEVVKLVPKIMSPLIGGVMRRYLKSQQIIFDALLPVAEQRCRERDLANLGHKDSNASQADCIQWIMETAPRQKPWTGKRVVHELMAIWFGSVHALSTTITFAIQDLCLHPEYNEPLREELVCEYADFEKTALGLPLLDSFLKESARLTPVESMSTRRCATKPFELSDGTKLAVGDWACTPVRAIMTSREFYPEPTIFHGFRFVDQNLVHPKVARKFAFLQPNPSKITDASQSWHVWGTGRMVCPGRFYATAVMKIIVGHIIMHYDCRLTDATANRWFTWRSTMLPKEHTMVVFTPIEDSTLA